MSIGNVFSLLASPNDLASQTLRPLENFGAISVDGVAIEGKDDWLFLYGGTNGYCDAYHLPEQTANSEVAGWIEGLSQYQKLCAKYNATFLPVIIPNKATILNGQYPKDLGAGITPILGLLLNRFNSILCPVRELKSRHHAEAIFRRNDSHLTEYGNLLFVKEILQGLAINEDGMLLPGELNYVNNNGDLGHRFDPPITEKVARINFHSNLSFEMVEIAPPIGAHTGLAYETTCASAPIKKRLLVFGNSFFDRPHGWSMAPYFCRLFSNVRFHWESGAYEDHISEYGPDYVIFQTCERFLSAQPRKIPFSNIGHRSSLPSFNKKDLNVKLSKDNFSRLVGNELPASTIYIGTHAIGRLDSGKQCFPMHGLVEYEDDLLKYGVTAVSDDATSVVDIDVSDYVHSYLGADRLLDKLQNSVSQGKWALYAYRPKGEGIIEVDFGIVLPVSMRHATFTITCEGKSPHSKSVYYDIHLGNTHWFMPLGCVIGIRCRYQLEHISPYLHFELRFDDPVSVRDAKAYRTLVTFTNVNMLKELPDLNRIHRVASKNANRNSFLNGGRAAYVALKEIAENNAVNFNDKNLRILDWGVGCGRVIRHFAELPPQHIFGIDIDKDNINWCRDNLRGEYLPISLYPPTELGANSFDFIYSCSVLSHLTEQDAVVWLEEINRLLCPGGLALLSYNGISNSASYLSRRPDEFRKVLEMSLFDSDVNHELDGFIPGKDYYRASFASDDWWRLIFNKHLKLIDIELSVVNGYQHVAVLRKK